MYIIFYFPPFRVVYDDDPYTRLLTRRGRPETSELVVFIVSGIFHNYFRLDEYKFFYLSHLRIFSVMLKRSVIILSLKRRPRHAAPEIRKIDII